MKILFFTRLFYPHIGGVETHVLELCKILKKDHEITIVTQFYDKKLLEFEVYDDIKIYRIPIGDDNWFKKFTIWIWLFKHRRLIQKADIVHAHDVFFWYFPFRFLFPTKKIYITFHGYETKFPPEKKAIIIRKLSEKLSRGNICVGDYIKKWYSTKPNYVMYGGTTLVYSSKLKIKSSLKKSKMLRIVFVGRLEKDIGVDLYLETLGELTKKRIPFNIDFLGEGSKQVQAEKYGKVYGFVRNPQKFLSGADIIFASSYLSMLDALVLEKKVIAAFDNSIKEDYLKMSPFKKFVFISNTSEEITQIIVSIQKEEWKYKSMIENGSKWARSQSWESVTNLYLKLWKI